MDRKKQLGRLRRRLEELSPTPSTFDQHVMAERAVNAHDLLNEAYALYRRQKGRDEEELLWSEAAALFHRAVGEAYPPNFWDAFQQLQKRNTEGLEIAISFLEADPWFFRSGYIKADILHLICALPKTNISPEDQSRLQRIVIAAVDFRDRREFRWYCKLARKVVSRSLITQLEERLSHADSNIRRRARWALSAVTHNPTFHIRRGISLHRKQKYSESIGHFSRAILLEPGSARSFMGRACVFFDSGQFAEAISDFTSVIEMRAIQFGERVSLKTPEGRHLTWMPAWDSHSWALYRRAETYCKVDRYDLAIADYTEAIRNKPNVDSFLRGRGKALYDIGDYDCAIDDLNKSILLNRSNPESYYFRGLAYVGMEQPEWAQKEFAQAQELCDRNSELFSKISNALRQVFR